MKLSIDLKPFTIEYPTLSKVPQNLITTSLRDKFTPTHKKLSFQEQFASETHPHRVKHVFYQYGMVKGRKAIMFYKDASPVRLIYSDEIDPYSSTLMNSIPLRTKFPPNTVSSNLARSLRENALKWIVDHFFGEINYMCFDEPILDGVNPDSFALPVSQAHEVLNLDSKKDQIEIINGQELVDVKINNALFIEIKAYHGTSIVGEKEVLQAFNYAAKGGKALLFTTGTLGTYETFDILNQQVPHPEGELSSQYDPKTYKKFVSVVKKKYKKLIRKIDMNISQDSYDTRGIYISTGSKLDKIYKYTSSWPDVITYKTLKTPEQIMQFLHSEERLGIVSPQAFEDLLHQKKLTQAAQLFKRVCRLYIEEIMLNPSLLYPREDFPYYISE